MVQWNHVCFGVRGVSKRTIAAPNLKTNQPTNQAHGFESCPRSECSRPAHLTVHRGLVRGAPASVWLLRASMSLISLAQDCGVWFPPLLPPSHVAASLLSLTPLFLSLAAFYSPHVCLWFLPVLYYRCIHGGINGCWSAEVGRGGCRVGWWVVGGKE
ncbi:hypothetical protein E2C01_058375 [Portunus trituberculatus]|uniref:Uncharacterized protein n=1 Tax=Portunus trituberculatus TaxID=210409 RepID=A0A5B7H2H2_PORTR|nr:hypothetical protein [Portunus trituberculatus]